MTSTLCENSNYLNFLYFKAMKKKKEVNEFILFRLARAPPLPSLSLTNRVHYGALKTTFEFTSSMFTLDRTKILINIDLIYSVDSSLVVFGVPHHLTCALWLRKTTAASRRGRWPRTSAGERERERAPRNWISRKRAYSQIESGRARAGAIESIETGK